MAYQIRSPKTKITADPYGKVITVRLKPELLKKVRDAQEQEGAKHLATTIRGILEDYLKE